MAAPAASCTGTERLATVWGCPFAGSSCTTEPVVLLPVPVNPPKTSMLPSTASATVLDSGEGSDHEARDTTRWGGWAGVVVCEELCDRFFLAGEPPLVA
jgi:hypothetical protein